MTSRGVATKIKMANEDMASKSLAKTKVLDFGLSPAQKFWSWTEFSLTLVLDERLRLWSKPKVLDCRV